MISSAARQWIALGVTGALAVLIPFMLFEDSVSAWVAAALPPGQRTATAVLVIVGALTLDILLPIPSSAVATASGALLGFVGGSLTTWLGLTAGCVVGYAIGRAVRDRGLPCLVSADAIGQARAASRRHGGWGLVICRGVPVMAELSVVGAGLTGYPFRLFLGVTGLANAGIAMVYAALGASAQSVDSFLLAFAGSIALPLAAFGLKRLFGGHGAEPEEKTP